MPEFCPKCDSVLLPKKSKNVLICRVCNQEFPLESKDKSKLSQYKVNKAKKLRDKSQFKTAVVEDSNKKNAISQEDREAYEDFFEVDAEPQEGGDSSD